MNATQGGPVVQVVQAGGAPRPSAPPNEGLAEAYPRVDALGGLGPVQAGGPGETLGNTGEVQAVQVLPYSLRGKERVGREYKLPGPGGPPRTTPSERPREMIRRAAVGPVFWPTPGSPRAQPSFSPNQPQIFGGNA